MSLYIRSDEKYALLINQNEKVFNAYTVTTYKWVTQWLNLVWRNDQKYIKATTYLRYFIPCHLKNIVIFMYKY